MEPKTISFYPVYGELGTIFLSCEGSDHPDDDEEDQDETDEDMDDDSSYAEDIFNMIDDLTKRGFRVVFEPGELPT